jgi:hypothetical protein
MLYIFIYISLLINFVFIKLQSINSKFNVSIFKIDFKDSVLNKICLREMSFEQVTVNSFMVSFVAPITHTLNENESDRQIFRINLSTMLPEVNLVKNNNEWWVDTGVTRHICSDNKMFSTYQSVEYGEQLFMGKSSTSKVEGKGKVILNMSSRKKLTLNDVRHVTDIHKNLVLGSLLSKNGFKLVFEFDKFVLTKSAMLVGKGYLSNRLFKMNVMTVVPINENKNKSSAYLIESSNVGHGRLGHVNYGILHRLVNLKLLPKFQIDINHKRETCVETKLTRTSFHSIERSSDPLELIHSDVCELKFVQTRGGRKYFITSIDDCTRYCYVYLLRSKDVISHEI